MWWRGDRSARVPLGHERPGGLSTTVNLEGLGSLPSGNFVVYSQQEKYRESWLQGILASSTWLSCRQLKLSVSD